MLALLETHICLVEVIFPLDFTQGDRINVDYTCSSEFNLIAPILSLASMKSSRESVESKQRVEEWVRNPAVNIKFISIHVNLSGTQ